MSDDESFENVTALDSRLEFLEREIYIRDNKIEAIQANYNSVFHEVMVLKTQLSAAKSYIETLPTQQEATKLKKCIIKGKELQKQLSIDLARLKEKNHELDQENSTLQKTVFDLNTSLKNKTAEIEALQYTVQLWERRRKAAREAGHLTVEDVLAEKMKLESHLEDVLKIAICREQRLKAKIDTMKVIVEEEQRTTREEKKNCSVLKEKVIALEATLEGIKQECINLQEVNSQLEQDVNGLASSLADAKARDECRSRTDSRVNHCISEIEQCSKAVDRMLNFIRSAIQGNFLDPSLLFSPFEDVGISGSDCADVPDLRDHIEERIGEIRQLKKNLEDCQKAINDLYVAKLSSSLSNQCNIQ